MVFGDQEFHRQQEIIECEFKAADDLRIFSHSHCLAMRHKDKI